jgi:soluble P-type ATPase
LACFTGKSLTLFDKKSSPKKVIYKSLNYVTIEATKNSEVSMISVSIPGWGDLDIEYLVIDYNGTCATDGKLKEGVKEMLEKVSRYIKVFIITADTYENVDSEVNIIGFKVLKVKKEGSGVEKARIVRELGPEKVVAVGNGANDVQMLKEASLGIGVMGEEGCFKDVLKEADLVVSDVLDALGAILHPERLVATLRD